MKLVKCAPMCNTGNMSAAADDLVDEEPSDSSDASSISDLFGSDDDMSDEFVWEVDPIATAPASQAPAEFDIMDRTRLMPGQVRMNAVLKSLERRALAEEAFRQRKRERAFGGASSSRSSASAPSTAALPTSRSAPDVAPKPPRSTPATPSTSATPTAPQTPRPSSSAPRGAPRPTRSKAPAKS